MTKLYNSEFMSKTNIGILGVGSIGSVTARYLSDNQQVKLFGFNRSLRDKTIVYFQNERFDIPIPINSIPFTKEPLDWLIVCLKEHHFAEAQPYFANLISDKTKVVVIRNGLRLTEPLLPFFQPNNLLACQIDCPTERLADGNFKQLREAILYVPKNNLAAQFCALLPDLSIRQEPDFKTASWKKLIESSAIGAITCLSGETCHIFKHNNLVALFERLVNESITVAQADGAQLSTDFTSILINKLLAYPPDKGSSMLSDRLAGKPIELGAKSGVIVRLGKEYRISTPLHSLVVDLLSVTNI